MGDMRSLQGHRRLFRRIYSHLYPWSGIGLHSGLANGPYGRGTVTQVVFMVLLRFQKLFDAFGYTKLGVVFTRAVPVFTKLVFPVHYTNRKK